MVQSPRHVFYPAVERTPWAHLDIAGKAWSDKSTATVPKGEQARCALIEPID